MDGDQPVSGLANAADGVAEAAVQPQRILFADEQPAIEHRRLLNRNAGLAQGTGGAVDGFQTTGQLRRQHGAERQMGSFRMLFRRRPVIGTTFISHPLITSAVTSGSPTCTARFIAAIIMLPMASG